MARCSFGSEALAMVIGPSPRTPQAIAFDVAPKRILAFQLPQITESIPSWEITHIHAVQVRPAVPTIATQISIGAPHA